MNTKVEEALGVLESAAGVLRYHAMRESAATLEEARTTLAAHLAQQATELAEAREGWHMANGVAELAMKHRDDAEAKVAQQDATIARLTAEKREVAEIAFDCCQKYYDMDSVPLTVIRDAALNREQVK